MSKLGPIAGFPEWLPEQRLIEQHLLDQVRRKFELYGFTSIETRAVEPLEVLLKKGASDKEIYVVRRLHGDESEKAELGLHFDLTVPFARYVAQHRGQLAFPMKRYQIQKVWRGERPQEGRYREFYQADVDVIGDGELSLHFDAEMALLLADVMAALPLPSVQLRINNRKVLEGFYRALGVDAIEGVLRTVDKIDKIGDEGVAKALVEEMGLAARAAEQCVRLAGIRGAGVEVVDAVRGLGHGHPLLDEGLAELSFVMDALSMLPPGAAIADLHIARGLDYYTGTVYEGVLVGHEALGSVCGGGRYDNLASGGKAKLPGVGVTVGVSRLVGWLLSRGELRASRGCPTSVLVALNDEPSRAEAYAAAASLRQRGIATEVFHAPQKFGKQIRYAERKGIPFVLFLGEAGAEVRDIRNGEQRPIDLERWSPPVEDLRVQVVPCKVQ